MADITLSVFVLTFDIAEIGHKIRFTEALQFIVNHLQPALTEVIVNCCYLSFHFGFALKKIYFV